MYDIILVPLDGSKYAETIIDHVIELARKFNSKLILLTAVEETELSPDIGQMASASMGNFNPIEEDINNAKAYLATLQKELMQNDIQVETRVITGSPAKVIIETAEQENANIIAIASHGHGGLARVLYGSVAAAVLKQAKEPLLLIRPKNIKEEKQG